MNSKNSKLRKPLRGTGFSLVEVIVATFIFALVAVPIYYAMSQSAAKEIDSTKLSMARKVLESFRAEIVGRPFSEIAGLNPGNPDFTNLPGGYPKTLSDVLTTQQKYKDFSFSPKFRFAPGQTSVIEVKGSVTWTKADKKPFPPEEIRFLIVKP